jgi:hypothetical protein
MKRWLCLLLSGMAVCWLLAFGRWEAVRSLHSSRCLACWTRSVGPWGEPTSTAPLAAARAEKPAACTLQLLLSEYAVGPPWLDGRGPPGKVQAIFAGTGLPVRPVAQAREAPSSQCGRKRRHGQSKGFCNSL